MKKKFIWTALVCAVTLLALIGCSSSIAPPVQGENGKVIVKLGTGAPASRTIAPDLGIFTKFDLSFSGPGVQASVQVIDGVAEVELRPGSWTITATGYAGEAAVAEGAVTVTITAGVTTQASILLGPKAGANGTLSYKITVPAALETAVLEIEGQPTVNLVAGVNESSISLAPGTFKVRVYLKQGDKEAGFTDALHIYAGLTTSILAEFKDDDFAKPVNFGSLSLKDYITAPVWNDPVPTITIPGSEQYTATVVWQPADTVFDEDTVYTAIVTFEAKDGYTLIGLPENAFPYDGAASTNAAGSGVITVVFPATAKGPRGDLEITIGFNYGELTIEGNNGVNLIYKDDNPSNLVLSISGYDDVKWYVDGNGIVAGAGDTVTISANAYRIGVHSLSFIGYRSGNLYGQVIPFVVRNQVGNHSRSQLQVLIEKALAELLLSYNGATQFKTTVENMIAEAQAVLAGGTAKTADQAYEDLDAALEIYNWFRTNTYYSRNDPGRGPQNLTITNANNVWSRISRKDSRIPSDTGSWEVIPYPFWDSDVVTGDLLRINYVHNGTSTFGGLTIQTTISPTISITANDFIEFTLYYSKDATGKYMRFWMGAGSASESVPYIRTENLNDATGGLPWNNLNPDWVGMYDGQTWYRKDFSISAKAASNASTMYVELHGETSRAAETGILLIGNLRFTRADPNATTLPNATAGVSQASVTPLKEVYNPVNGTGGKFMVGAIGTGSVSGIRARHYEIFVNGNNLKPQPTHGTAPSWLSSNNLEGSAGTSGFSFPTSDYQGIRDSGSSGQYKAHGHVMAWYNQSPSWMTAIGPNTLVEGDANAADGMSFFGRGNSTPTTLTKKSIDVARKVQYEHIMVVMRHFLTNSSAYGSSTSRGPIPFHSWDILNEEIHESRHSVTIGNDPTSWRNALKHTNWLVAMSDNLIAGADIKEHYIYLLFKYAHMAGPNAQMIAKINQYKDDPTVIPSWMKAGGHLDNLDTITFAPPPKLTYNDYGIATYSKARVAYNMIRELNTAWLSDPLYDGRNLIEDMGIQGHDSLGPTLASNNQVSIAMYATLIDEGLLDGISYSELDIKLPASAPGGGKLAPATLNVLQWDALGYQYALLYRVFTKYEKYIDHIISWGLTGSGWQDSFVLFDSSSRAEAGYYGAINPDKWLLGHQYLEYYFKGEYEKVQDDYIPPRTW